MVTKMRLMPDGFVRVRDPAAPRRAKTIEEWLMSRRPTTRWRREAREAIQKVVEAIVASAPDVLSDHKSTLRRVDSAYPFGERDMFPYKAWLRERKLFRTALESPALPTKDEADVCEVARDMVLEGRLDDARKLLEQAPNRLARKCQACGVAPGRPCVPAKERRCACGWRGTTADGGRSNRCPSCGAASEDSMLVPHHARLVGHLDAGPLFTGDR